MMNLPTMYTITFKYIRIVLDEKVYIHDFAGFSQIVTTVLNIQLRHGKLRMEMRNVSETIEKPNQRAENTQSHQRVFNTA